MDAFRTIEISSETFVCAYDVAKYCEHTNTSLFVNRHFYNVTKKYRRLYVEKSEVESYLAKKENSKKIHDMIELNTLYQKKVSELNILYQKKVSELKQHGKELTITYLHHIRQLRINENTLADIWYHIKKCPCYGKTETFPEYVNKKIKEIENPEALWM